MEGNVILSIPKEEIPALRFPSQDVLQDQEAMALRQQRLEEASVRGNMLKDKVKLVLQTTEGPRMVETTVWNAGHSYISLKYGMKVPIRAILDVQA
ncbi:MAG: hypothetical protein D6722_05305 [Bacteroidetes bacterium]|nr:MAG: hypothetical protein D6722_05305 [Bacteroidota bacterium]